MCGGDLEGVASITQGLGRFSKVGHVEVGHIFVSNLTFLMRINNLGQSTTQRVDVRPEGRLDARKAH